MLALILYIIAVCLLALAAFGISHGRVAFGWLGLALWCFTAGVLPHLT